MSGLPSKIRVCHLASGDLWAGAEVQVVNVCRALLDTGEVELSAVVLNRGRLAEELQSLGFELTVIDEQRHNWGGVLWKLVRHLRERPVDVLHTHRYKENVLGSAAAKIAGVPRTVRTVHGTVEIYSGWKRTKMKAYAAVDGLVCRHCVDGFIGVSREITAALEQRFPGKSIAYIPNCIDRRRVMPTLGREEKRLELGLKASEFVIGTVGRLTPVKGIEYLIRATAEIVKRREGIRLLVVGDGPLRPYLEQLVQSLGLEKTVSFLGQRADSIDIINTLDLFVLPSIHEGTPTVLLEAMSLGIPVVASATGGIPEIISDGVNGILTPVADESSLAAKCIRQLSDQHVARRLSDNGRQKVREYYLKEAADRFLSVYRCLANGTAP